MGPVLGLTARCVGHARGKEVLADLFPCSSCSTATIFRGEGKHPDVDEEEAKTDLCHESHATGYVSRKNWDIFSCRLLPAGFWWFGDFEQRAVRARCVFAVRALCG